MNHTTFTFTFIFVFLAMLFCSGTQVKAQETNIERQTLLELKGLKASQVLKKARALQYKDRVLSQTYANESIRISGGDYITAAKAYRLLANLETEQEKASDYFLQASLFYEKAADTPNQITSLISSNEILLKQKRYREADKALQELLLIAIDFNQGLSLGITYIALGDSDYEQKKYDKAIKQYKKALDYLLSIDKSTTKYKAQAYKRIAESYKRLKNREETAKYYKKALDIYTLLGDKKLIARTLNTLAEAERYIGNLLMALDYSMRGLDLHEEIDDPEGQAKSLVGAGIIYRYIGRYEKSINHIYKAHLYYKKINDINKIASTSNQMGLVYTKLEQFQQAKSFYQVTIDLPPEQVELTTLASALREMAVIELEEKQYSSASIMAKKARQIYQIKNDALKESLVARIIGNIYREQKDYHNAILNYRESLLLAVQSKNKTYQVKAQISLANVLINKDAKQAEQGIDEAINLLQQALVISNYINDKKQKVYIYNTLRKAEKRKGNLTKSLSYAEKEIELINLIQKDKENNKLVLAKANLHSYKMEIELESLRERAKLDQLELVKKNNEIEIATQTKTITELELVKNKYASLALASLLAICVFLVILIYRRFDASKKDNKELKHLAIRDPLTNCYNRRFLFDLLDENVKDEKLTEYCVVMVDIDHFKNVNDTYGHSKGDTVLSGVANILQSCVRESDIVVRYGGEEFCIVLPHTTDHKAVTIANNMRIKIETSFFDGLSVTCSFGVSSVKCDADSASNIIDQADLALYESKSRGRNQVTLWFPKLGN